MDITITFSECLSQRGLQPISPPVFSEDKLNKFLQEAYSIVRTSISLNSQVYILLQDLSANSVLQNTRISELTTYLRAIRPSYLHLQPHRPAGPRKHAQRTRDKNQQLSDHDRVRIDHETKTVLTILASAIKDLSDTAALDASLASSIAEKKRSKRGFGAIGRWAAGETAAALSPEDQREERARNTLKLFRENVIWYLQRKIEGASNRQREMIEVRLERERERSKSSLYRAQNTNTSSLVNGLGVSGMNAIPKISGAELQAEQEKSSSRDDQGDGGQGLSEEQRQIFAREEQDMLRQYNDELNKIKTAESSLMEISSLQSQLAMNLGKFPASGVSSHKLLLSKDDEGRAHGLTLIFATKQKLNPHTSINSFRIRSSRPRTWDKGIRS